MVESDSEARERGLSVLVKFVGGLNSLTSLFFSVPIVGRASRQLWSFAIDIFWRVISVPGLLMDQMGLVLPKYYRISILIVTTTGTEADPGEALLASIEDARRTFWTQARVELVVETIKTIRSSALMSVGRDFEAWLEDLWTKGTAFETESNQKGVPGSGRRLIGYGAPVLVFVVGSVKNGAGCSLGPFSDYVTVAAPSTRCLSHELGHACGLWHHAAGDNLMKPSCKDENLLKWQVAMVRSSRHVTYW